MKKLFEGNFYNVEQSVTSSTGKDVSKAGLSDWNREVRKQLMEKLRQYSPEQIDKIIKATFGDTI